MFWTMHEFASSDEGSGLGVISMDGTVTAMIATCATSSATNSVTRKTSRDLLRP